MRKLRFPLAVCAALLFTAPAFASGLKATDLAKAKAVTEAWAKAAAARDWDALAALYAEDAILLPPHEGVLRGRTAIREYFGKSPQATDIKVTDVEIKGTGDLVYVAGTYSMMIHMPGRPPTKDEGKFLDVRRKQADGSWLIVCDTFNSSMPAHVH